MNKIIIDFGEITNKDLFHKLMIKKFNLPDYYGENLDALWDCLTEFESLDIDIINPSLILENLGDYGKSIISLFDDLRDFDNFNIKYIKDDNISNSKKKDKNIVYDKSNYKEYFSNIYLLDGAKIIGDVKIGENSSIWYNAIIRGDDNSISIGKNSNIQDNACIHVGKNSKVSIGDNVSVGHGVIVHGATIEDDVIIGMGSTILDNSYISKNSIVGANSLVTKNKKFPEGSLIMGSPAKFIRKLNQEEIDSIRQNAKDYVNKVNR